MSIRNLGICITCNVVDECVRFKHNSLTRWYCEEFEGFTSQVQLRANATEHFLSDVELSAHKEKNGYVGLCASCDTKEACVYPVPQGGVWHCNEYN